MLLLPFLFLAAQPAVEFGANFNHDPELIELADLKRIPVRWVRTTPYIFEYIRGVKQPETEPGLARIIEAKQAGYRVAFGFRWDFRKHRQPIPEPGSDTERSYFAVARRILDRVGPSIDLFKLGNEPTLETLDADLQPGADGAVPLVRFTARLLTEVVEPYFRAHPERSRPPVYVGSLPALFEPGMQRLPAVTELIRLAETNEAIAGLSIHLHIKSEADMAEVFRFVRARLPRKPIIVPEFSLHRLYLAHMKETLGVDAAGRRFAAKYRRDPEMKLHEWYSLANHHQVSSAEWEHLFHSRSWFPRHFLRVYDGYFERNGVVLATYGWVSQYGPPTVPAEGAAWFVNPILPFKSLPPRADGSKPANPLWFDDFTRLVRKTKAPRQ